MVDMATEIIAYRRHLAHRAGTRFYAEAIAFFTPLRPSNPCTARPVPAFQPCGLGRGRPRRRERDCGTLGFTGLRSAANQRKSILRLLVSRACRIRDAEPSVSNALLQASAPSKPPHQPLRRVFLRFLFAARLCLALARRVTAAERGARFERSNPSDREGELSGRSALWASCRAAGANQSAGTYGGVYVESR